MYNFSLWNTMNVMYIKPSLDVYTKNSLIHNIILMIYRINVILKRNIYMIQVMNNTFFLNWEMTS